MLPQQPQTPPRLKQDQHILLLHKRRHPLPIQHKIRRPNLHPLLINPQPLLRLDKALPHPSLDERHPRLALDAEPLACKVEEGAGDAGEDLEEDGLRGVGAVGGAGGEVVEARKEGFVGGGGVGGEDEGVDDGEEVGDGMEEGLQFEDALEGGGGDGEVRLEG